MIRHDGADRSAEQCKARAQEGEGDAPPDLPLRKAPDERCTCRQTRHLCRNTQCKDTLHNDVHVRHDEMVIMIGLLHNLHLFE